jgi:putative peptidoglycan lipid II flippase
MMAGIAIIVFLLVSMVAAGTAFLTSFLSGSNEESPLGSTQQTMATSTEATAPVGPPLYLELQSAQEWDQGIGEEQDIVIDNDSSTSWTSTGATGLLVSLENPAQLAHVVLTPGSGADSAVTSTVKIFAFDSTNPTSLSEGIELGEVEFSARSIAHRIEKPDNVPDDTESVVIWVEDVTSSDSDEDAPTMQIAEVEMAGW